MRGGLLRLLRQPVFTGAVAVLAVNDHVLKPAFGGRWTGKVSDFAGVFVVAVLVGTVTTAPRPSVVVVGAGFAALKLVPGVAELGALLLGGMTRRDPTDLAALAALVPALAFLESDERGCFRVAGRAVEHRTDGSQRWDTSFAFTAEQERRLSHRRSCGVPDEFTAVAVVPRADGDHVVVAMGGQGVLHLPPGGGWERRAVVVTEPVRLDGPSWLAHGRPLPLAVLLVSIVLFVVAGDRKRVERAAMVVLIGGVGLLMVSGALLFFGVDYTIAGPLVAGLSVAVFAASLAPFLWTRVRRTTR